MNKSQRNELRNLRQKASRRDEMEDVTWWLGQPKPEGWDEYAEAAAGLYSYLIEETAKAVTSGEWPT